MERRFRFRQKTEQEKRNIRVDVKKLPEWKAEIDVIKNEFKKFSIQYVKNAINNLDKANRKIGYGGIYTPRHVNDLGEYVQRMCLDDLVVSSNTGLLSDPTFNSSRLGLPELITYRAADAARQLNVSQDNGVSQSGFWSIFSGKETKENFERYVKEKDECESHLSMIPIIEKSNKLLNEVINLSNSHAKRFSYLIEKVRDAEEKLGAIQRFEAKHGNAFAKAAAVDSKTRSRASSMKRLIGKNSNCPYCGVVLDGFAHLDHIYPVAMGGLSVPENLVWCCVSCNTKKSDKGLMSFAVERGLEISHIIKNLKDLNKHI